VGLLTRTEGSSHPPLLGPVDPLSALTESSNADEDERDEVARSAILVMLAKGGDPSPSCSGKDDDDDCANSIATVVNSDHCAVSHGGDERMGVDDSEVDITDEVLISLM
jgi:hypothetical protein